MVTDRFIHMSSQIILASGSKIRADLLQKAGLTFDITVPRIDEEMIKISMEAESAPPRDVADALAGLKAERVARKNPDSYVLGCDQVLSLKGKIISKPADQSDALDFLKSARGETHTLLSAAVVYYDHQPIWRHVGVVRMSMKDMSDAYLENYVQRNWESIRHSVGAYKLEEEGVRLFRSVQGDYFHVLGLPLLEFLAFLGLRGVIET